MLKLNLESKEVIGNGCGNTVTQFTINIEKNKFFIMVDEDSYSIRRNSFESESPSIIREGNIFDLRESDCIFDIIWEARNIHTNK